jgi:hypothetical protein
MPDDPTIDTTATDNVTNLQDEAQQAVSDGDYATAADYQSQAEAAAGLRPATPETSPVPTPATSKPRPPTSRPLPPTRRRKRPMPPLEITQPPPTTPPLLPPPPRARTQAAED